MAVYLKMYTSGRDLEGIGSVAQDFLAYYAVSKLLNIELLFEGFTRLQHFQYNKVTQDKFCQDVNDLFSVIKIAPDHLRSAEAIHVDSIENLIDLSRKAQPDQDIIVDINQDNLLRFFRGNIDLVQKLDVFKALRESMMLPNKNSVIDVAVHIRNINEKDVDFNPARELFNSQRESWYFSLIKNIVEELEKHSDKNQINIHSQGVVERFLFFKKLETPNTSINLHIEEYPIETLRQLATSDILVCANSSFSYVAGMIGNQIQFVRDNFWNPTFSKKRIILDRSGNFDKNNFSNLLLATELVKNDNIL